MTWVPMPLVTIFPGSPRLGPALSDFPSLTFRTPSTVFSALDLASLFHPAATFRFSPSGVSPSLRIGARISPALSPPVVRPSSLRFPAPARYSVDFRGFLPAASAVTSVVVETTLAPRPSWLLLSSGFLLPNPGTPFGMPPSSTFTAMSPPRRVPDVLRDWALGCLCPGCQPVQSS